MPTPRRVVLTGTPIQNDLQEFFSIVEFCNPGLLGMLLDPYINYFQKVSRTCGYTYMYDIYRKRKKKLRRYDHGKCQLFPNICLVLKWRSMLVLLQDSFLSGSSGSFKRVFENPIVASRQPSASPEDIELGAERGSELSRITKLFVLRRSQEINIKYLPPKCMKFLF